MNDIETITPRELNELLKGEHSITLIDVREPHEFKYARIDGADALLVAGTSLAVFSGYRFLLRAAERRTPIVIVNRGPVRGEERATMKIEASTGATLAALADALASP